MFNPFIVYFYYRYTNIQERCKAINCINVTVSMWTVWLFTIFFKPITCATCCGTVGRKVFEYDLFLIQFDSPLEHTHTHTHTEQHFKKLHHMSKWPQPRFFMEYPKHLLSSLLRVKLFLRGWSSNNENEYARNFACCL